MSNQTFNVAKLRVRNIGSDVPAVIAQRAVAGCNNEPYHYSLVNFAVQFDVARPHGRQGKPRIFWRLRCEMILPVIQKTYSSDIAIDLAEGEEWTTIEKEFYSVPIGQPEPCLEHLTVRLLDGDLELAAITVPVAFSPSPLVAAEAFVPV